MKLYQKGFTLIELMVAMVVGLVIVLGAGRLFLMGHQNFRYAESLSERQAALTFAADAMVREVRRSGSLESFRYENGELKDASGEPLVSGLCQEYSLDPVEGQEGVFKITLHQLALGNRGGEEKCDSFSFYAVHRTEKIT